MNCSSLETEANLLQQFSFSLSTPGIYESVGALFMNGAENFSVSEAKTESRQEPQEKVRNILFIDNGHRDRRRERNAALKDAGYRVHPARSFDQSLSRIGSGAYDLIIASTDAADEQAQRFIEEVKRNFPRQKLLVLKASEIDLPGDVECCGNDPRSLRERVEAMFRPASSGEQKLAA